MQPVCWTVAYPEANLLLHFRRAKNCKKSDVSSFLSHEKIPTRKKLYGGKIEIYAGTGSSYSLAKNSSVGLIQVR